VNKTRGLLGIMVANPGARKAILASYLRYNKTQLRLFSFAASDINWERKTIAGLHRSNRKWQKGVFPFPDVIYNRCYDLDHELIERLEAEIGTDKCFNHVNHLNKFEIHNHLSKRLDCYLPETVLYDPKNAANLLIAHKLLYFKPCFGNKGLGVYRVEMKESGEIHIGDHYILPKRIMEDISQFQEEIHSLIGSKPYIIQKGIDVQSLTGRTFDIRVLAQKNETGSWSITSAISRVAFKGCFNTSIFEKMCTTREALLYLFPPYTAQSILRFIYHISLRAAENLESDCSKHMGEMSIDLALDNDSRLWIIEINGMPQKNLYRDFQSHRTVYRRPLEYASYLQLQKH
jgi:hypothetical protein